MTKDNTNNAIKILSPIDRLKWVCTGRNLREDHIREQKQRKLGLLCRTLAMLLKSFMYVLASSLRALQKNFGQK